MTDILREQIEKQLLEIIPASKAAWFGKSDLYEKDNNQINKSIDQVYWLISELIDRTFDKDNNQQLVESLMLTRQLLQVIQENKVTTDFNGYNINTCKGE